MNHLGRRLAARIRTQWARAGQWLIRAHGDRPRLLTLGADALAGSSVAEALGFGSLSGDRLVAVYSDPSTRQLLLAPQGVTAESLLNMAVAHPDLADAVRRFIAGVDDAKLSRAVYGAIVLDQASGPSRLIAALGIATANVDRLVPQEERAIFVRCLEILRRPVDPYDQRSASIRGAANQAAAAILAGDSGLDPLVLEGLRDPSAQSSFQALAASALKERPAEAALRFLDYLSAVAAGSAEAVRFAEDCDASRGALREVPRRQPRLRERLAAHVPRNPWDRVQIVGAAVVPAVIAVALAHFAKHANPTLIQAGIDPGVAIGALAVLATVHVLSVQLAAQRLPGPVALATVLAPAALAAYLTVVLMLVAAILGQRSPSLSWHPSLVASGLLVFAVGLIIATTISSMRATGAATACERVGTRKLRQARRTGKRVGRLAASAARVQRIVDTNGSLRMFSSPDEAVERFAIRAPAAGYLHVDSERLEDLATRPEWREGRLRLDVLVLPGAPVTPAQELASVVPSAGARLDEDEIRAAERIFKIGRERRVERFAELSVSLCAQIPAIVRGGDPGGARRVLAVLDILLHEQLVYYTKHRGDVSARSIVSPAVTQVIEQAVSALATALGETERDLISRLLTVILRNARKEDGLITFIAFKVDDDASNLAEFGALYSAGCRAAQLRSSIELNSVQSKFAKLVAGRSESARYANEVAGRLVLYCAVVAPELSRAVWTRWWGASGRSPEQDRQDIASRIGAGALPVGNLSLAMEVALALRGADFEGLIQRAHKPEQASFENFLSELYGRLLRSDAESRIVAFLEFARRVNELVA